MDVRKLISICQNKKGEEIKFNKELTFDLPYVNLKEYEKNG